MRRVFIVHCWGGTSESDWYGWLAGMLRERGFEATVLDMPDTNHPKIQEWVDTLSKSVDHMDGDTYLVGHSIGCQTILRYLSGLKEGRGAGALFVAPWIHLKDGSYESDEDMDTARPWLDTPLDMESASERMQHFSVIMAKDDPYVPVSDSEIFKERLNASINIMPIETHFTGDEGYKELHVAFNEFMKMVK